MRRIIKKYVIPHKGNNHTPHLLREAGAFGLLACIILLFAATAGQVTVIKNNKLAAVLSPVLVDLMNTVRHAQNLPSLTQSPLLTRAATLKATDMATKGYFAHPSPEG